MKVFTIVLLFYSACTFGQSFFSGNVDSGRKPVWSNGKVTLNDGTELNGLVKYDSRTGEVAFRDATVAKRLTSRHVLGFEFIDSAINKRRAFLSIEIPGKVGSTAASIVEVLRAYETFAVLSHIHLVEDIMHNNNAPVGQNRVSLLEPAGVVEASRHETILFLPVDGEPLAYLEVVTNYLEFVTSESTSMFFPGTDRKKIETKDAFEQCTGSMYPAIKAFAKENSLSFTNKNDLLRMLDFYELQVAKEK